MKPSWTGLRLASEDGRLTRRTVVSATPSRGMVEGPMMPPGSYKSKQVRTSAGSITLGAPGMHYEQLAAVLRTGAHSLSKWALSGCGAVAGLVGLLYITSFFESVMHSSSGLIANSSVPVATLTGLAVGTLHTVAGPDHLAGLAPLVVGRRRSPAAAFGLGALWGSGHATGQLLIGLACLLVHVGLIKTAWAPAFEQFSALLVGASLVAIGAFGLSEAREFEEQESDTAPRRSRFGWATYATGVLHGLSPDAIIFVAPALALPRIAAVCHVTGVVVGTLLAMGTCTALLSALCRRNPKVKAISSGASSVAVLLGVCIVGAFFGVVPPLPGL